MVIQVAHSHVTKGAPASGVNGDVVCAHIQSIALRY
jgi:hypothetical protein